MQQEKTDQLVIPCSHIAGHSCQSFSGRVSKTAIIQQERASWFEFWSDPPLSSPFVDMYLEYLCSSSFYLIVHHNLFRALLLGFKAGAVLVKQPCYITTKMYRLYRKMTIFFGSIFKQCYIQNHVVMNSVKKRFVCTDKTWTFFQRTAKQNNHSEQNHHKNYN